ncbi:hypothetical protein Lepto7375DRAFT_4461 [Leptolyngbya sp. PCC 7375]|nr:hypothetical protein Lepto7375DRAFT_4461 [Leptolyngbya sp. PCC 7375]
MPVAFESSVNLEVRLSSKKSQNTCVFIVKFIILYVSDIWGDLSVRFSTLMSKKRERFPRKILETFFETFR